MPEIQPENLTEIHMVTVQCLQEDCLSILRLGRFIRLPVTRVGAIKFCAICGGRAAARFDTDESYWETLAKAYELPVFAVQEIYKIWPQNEYPNFRDFVNVMKKEAGLVA